jgi:glutamine amidotransferase
MNVVIIQYNAGNIRSVSYALERLGYAAIVSDDVSIIQQADKVIFPGVGEASSAMQYLQERKLDVVIKNLQQPVLGICLGMQLMCSFSEENDTPCLGIFTERVQKFVSNQQAVKVPHMGWSKTYELQTPLFQKIDNHSFFYFVHSYYAAVGAETIATTNYIQPFSAALRKRNFYGVQFHPEKSANAGEQLLKNFMELC